MAPVGREHLDISRINTAKVKQAAVLALFYKKQNQPHLVLTLRVQSGGVHSGQISLPGGKREPQDNNFMDTALRETYEEVGLAPENVEVLGELTPLYIPPSNFLVFPFVGLYHREPYFERQVSEVKEIFSLDFNHFLDSATVVQQEVKARELNLNVPVFSIDGHVIWGATAMILSELREMILARISNPS